MVVTSEALVFIVIGNVNGIGIKFYAINVSTQFVCALCHTCNDTCIFITAFAFLQFI